jgi:hypothetical protein
MFLALASLLAAQTPKPAVQPVRFSVFSAQTIAGLGFAPQQGSGLTTLAFYPTARSPGYEYRGALPLRFVDVASGTVVAEAGVPAEIHDALLLFAPMDGAAAGALKYRVAVLDDGAASHAAGGLVVINFSGLALSGTIGGKAVTLDEGLNAPRKVGRATKILLKTTVKSRSFQSYGEDVKMKATERALLILFPPFNPGSVEVQSRLLIDAPLPRR